MKARSWIASIKPDAFWLLAGEAELTEYQFNSKSIHHLFCKHCGVRSFGWGDIPELGGQFYVINVACLDDVGVDELVSAPITYIDGRNDNWQSPPAETRHL
jgi:hypothetical protein